MLLSHCLNELMPPSTPLSDADATLAHEVGFPPEIVGAIRDAGGALRQLQGRDDDGEPIPAQGLSIDVARRVPIVIAALRKKLGPDYLVFRSEQRFGKGPDEVSVLRTADQYEALRVMSTNGWNHDISPDAVIARLRQWDAEFGLALLGAGFDWMEAQMRQLPKDMLAFAEAVYAFCPDVVDQGTETVSALADEMRRTRTLYLWWD
jgi:Domain of unknown function (DUF4253)